MNWKYYYQITCVINILVIHKKLLYRSYNFWLCILNTAKKVDFFSLDSMVNITVCDILSSKQSFKRRYQGFVERNEFEENMDCRGVCVWYVCLKINFYFTEYFRGTESPHRAKQQQELPGSDFCLCKLCFKITNSQNKARTKNMSLTQVFILPHASFASAEMFFFATCRFYSF